ncbi:MAG: leucyl/phenylalanyl-tRNA--protein transferase [Treponema sp.]|nr:leucyl/phenylalanyl-tRNA--protein transferase [Treponema sp.]
MKHSPYTYTMDRDFRSVIEGCREVSREDQSGTWIGDKIIRAYCELHEVGIAHSFEVWHGEKLVGGFYGELLGSVFCGESMFTLESDSSKSAFALFARAFKKCGGKLIDCQAYTDNMARYGAVEISRSSFRSLEIKYLNIPLAKDLRRQFEEDVKSFPVVTDGE